MKILVFVFIISYCNSHNAQLINRNDTIRNLLETYQYKSALGVINKQLEIDTSNSNLYLLKGNALKGLLKYSDAIHSYETTLSLDSSNYSALIETANAYKLLGDCNKSFSYLIKANHLNPSNISVKLEIANTLLFQENFEEAKNIYLNLYNHDTTKTFLLRNLARCYEKINDIDSTI